MEAHDLNGNGEVQLSPNGGSISVINLSKALGWFTAARQAVIQTYTLGGSHLAATTVKPLCDTVGSTLGKASLAYTQTLPLLSYATRGISKGSGGVYALLIGDTTASTVTRLIPGISGDIRSDGRTNSLYIAAADTDLVYTLAESGLIGLSGLSVINAGKPWGFTGYMGSAPLWITSRGDEFITARTIGQKRYELKDHLGNVRVLVSDARQATLNNSGIITSTSADILGYNQYFAFGMLQPGRNLNPGESRFGFNGKEKTDEIYGTGNAYDYGERTYSSREGRFLSVDPISREYPELSTYQFASNTPIFAIDRDGLEMLPNSYYTQESVKGSAKVISTTSESVIDGMVFAASHLVKGTYTGIKYAITDGASGSLYQPLKFSWSKGLENDEYTSGRSLTPENGIRFVSGVSSIVSIANPLLKGYSLKYANNPGILATNEGHLLGTFKIRAPFNINVHRYGLMTAGEPKAFTLGSRAPSKFSSRVFSAVKPEWNDLSISTSGYIPKGEEFRIGLSAPQKPYRVGFAPQIQIDPSKVIVNKNK